MSHRSLVALVALATGLGLASGALAQARIVGGLDGGQMIIGSLQPRPLQPPPALPGPGALPPLLVAPIPFATVMTFGPGFGTFIAPTGVLTTSAMGTFPVFPSNPAVLQVATNIDYSWPAVAATFSTGGAPGPAVFGTSLGGSISNSGGIKAFGGAGQFAISPGPGAAGGRVPGAAGTAWINGFAILPPDPMATVGVVGTSVGPLGVAAPGASPLAPPVTTMFGGIATGIGIASVGPLGTILASVPVVGAFPSDALSDKGFPWSTGFVTISQPAAVPPIFFLSGTDMRVGGVGNVSMVSGSLGVRMLSGPFSQRAWVSLTLPEPAAALGLAGALGVLALCHRLVLHRTA